MGKKKNRRGASTSAPIFTLPSYQHGDCEVVMRLIARLVSPFRSIHPTVGSVLTDLDEVIDFIATSMDASGWRWRLSDPLTLLSMSVRDSRGMVRMVVLFFLSFVATDEGRLA
jgi:hypothetical protein